MLDSWELDSPNFYVLVISMTKAWVNTLYYLAHVLSKTFLGRKHLEMKEVKVLN